jgi:uncharacterized protein YjbI with pentapeptide repeats
MNGMKMTWLLFGLVVLAFPLSAAGQQLDDKPAVSKDAKVNPADAKAKARPNDDGTAQPAAGDDKDAKEKTPGDRKAAKDSDPGSAKVKKDADDNAGKGKAGKDDEPKTGEVQPKGGKVKPKDKDEEGTPKSGEVKPKGGKVKPKEKEEEGTPKTGEVQPKGGKVGKAAFRVALVVAHNGKNPVLLAPSSDAAQLADRLQRAGFDKVVVLNDDAKDDGLKPTKKNFLHQLTELAALFKDPKEKEASCFLVFFSGHGEIKDGQQYYLTEGFDFDQKDYKEATAEKDILNVLFYPDKCKAKYRVLIVDACRSASDKEERTKYNAEEIKLNVPANVVIINSCLPGQESQEDQNLGRGVFTHYLMRGLQGAAATNDVGKVTLEDVFDYTEGRVKNYVETQLEGKAQLPQRFFQPGLDQKNIDLGQGRGTKFVRAKDSDGKPAAVTQRDININVWAPGGSLAGCVLDGLDLSYVEEGSAKGPRNFLGVDFAGAKLRRLTSKDTQQPQPVNLNKSIFGFADFSKADLTGAVIGSGTWLQQARFVDAVLDEANLKDADLSAVDFTGASFKGADLSGARFNKYSSLKGAKFTSPMDGETGKKETDLSKVDFGDVDLSGADFEGANIEGADLSRVRGFEAILNLSKAKGKAKLPEGAR